MKILVVFSSSLDTCTKRRVATKKYLAENIQLNDTLIDSIEVQLPVGSLLILAHVTKSCCMALD